MTCQSQLGPTFVRCCGYGRNEQANAVRVELVFKFKHHFASLVIVRGSIPLFWPQPGYNYRLPPVLYKSDNENYARS